MEFNQIPEGRDVQGGQKRRTEFESEDDKLRYDVKNIRRILEESTMRDVTTDQIIKNTQRKDDDSDQLRRAIEIEEQEALLVILKARFDTQSNLHQGIQWADVETSLRGNTEAFAALKYMEETGGEPDVLRIDGNDLVFVDTSSESPTGRRDRAHWRAVKELKHGLELMSEDDYMYLQNLKHVDSDSYSWLGKPSASRPPLAEDTALFGLRKSNEVGVRPRKKTKREGFLGFRCSLRVKIKS